MTRIKLRVVGKNGLERNLKERVHRDTSYIYRRNTGRSEYHEFFPGIGAYIFQECRFSRTRLSGKKHRLAGETYQFPRVLKLLVVKVNILLLRIFHKLTEGTAR